MEEHENMSSAPLLGSKSDESTFKKKKENGENAPKHCWET